MGYVVYDVETTGLRRGFDQILQFAAVLTDERLQVVDRIDARCRLSPHIIPAAEALLVSGTDVQEILGGDTPSHYGMIRDVQARLSSWGPSLYLGFNSMRFDEEFLRQAFYQCLFPAYLTNTGGSARADVLALARVAAALRPGVLQPHRDETGRAVFRLADLAAANGVVVRNAHSAAGDVEMTLALCRRLQAGAGDLWSRFVQFSQKSTAATFVRDEDAFLLFQAFGDHGRARVLTRIGEHDEQANRQYCLDLEADFDALEALDDEALTARFRSRDGPLVVVKTNTAPLLCPVYDALEGEWRIPSLDEAEERARGLRDRPGFVSRLARAARRAEREYPPPTQVEQKLYGFPFPSFADERRMQAFHAADWSDRLAIAMTFEDPRYRQLGRRIVFFERPELLPQDQRQQLEDALRHRLHSEDPDCPWLSAASARAALVRLASSVSDPASIERLISYRAYLDRLAPGS